MYFISGTIALVGSALVLSIKHLSSNGFTDSQLYPNSNPLNYGDIIAIILYLFSLYCFYKHNKAENISKNK